MTSVRVLRLRPRGQTSEGLSKVALRNLALALGGTEDFASRSEQFEPDDGDIEEQLRLFTISFKAQLSAADIFILDLGFRTIVRTHWVAIAEALDQAREGVSSHNKRILILTLHLPPVTSPLMHKLRKPDWRTHVQICNADGQFWEEELSWALPVGTREACRNTAEVRLTALRSRLLRMRGVFFHPSKGSGSYTQFRYIGDFATWHLATNLASFMQSLHLNVVIANANASTWFMDALKRACIESELPLVALGLDDGLGVEQMEDVLARLSEQSVTHALIAVPVYRNGDEARNLLRQVEQILPHVTPYFFAVFAHEGSNKVSESSEFGEMRSVRANSRQVSLSYVKPIENAHLPADHWLVRVARQFDEILEPPHVWVPPTRTAMWSLFDKYGFATEQSPEPERELQVAHFPNLHKIDEEDARWLAYAMLQRVGLDAEETLVVLPDDPTAAKNLAGAFENSLDVSTVVVPRRYLDGGLSSTISEEDDGGEEFQRIVEKLEDYREYKVVIADESSMGGKTLARYTQFVERYSRQPDAVVVVIAAKTSVSESVPQALYGWNVNDVVLKGEVVS